MKYAHNYYCEFCRTLIPAYLSMNTFWQLRSLSRITITFKFFSDSVSTNFLIPCVVVSSFSVIEIFQFQLYQPKLFWRPLSLPPTILTLTIQTPNFTVPTFPTVNIPDPNYVCPNHPNCPYSPTRPILRVSITRPSVLIQFLRMPTTTAGLEWKYTQISVKIIRRNISKMRTFTYCCCG